MGETIADSTHAATILRNIPKSWRTILQTIQIITRDPDEIEEQLKAHEADLNALETSSQAATAFAVHTRQGRPPAPPKFPNNVKTRPYQYSTTNSNLPRPSTQCNNCHNSASRCYAPGGEAAGQAPWKSNPKQYTNSFVSSSSTPNTNNYTHQFMNETKQMAANAQENQLPKTFIMVALMTELADDRTNMKISSHLSSLSEIKNGSHLWLIDSAASSHLSGKKSMFLTMEDIPPVQIECISGDTFTANQKGTINISITSDPTFSLPDVPITLTNVIYVLKLQANLLSVG